MNTFHGTDRRMNSRQNSAGLKTGYSEEDSVGVTPQVPSRAPSKPAQAEE
jgi:hypothetical protein